MSIIKTSTGELTGPFSVSQLSYMINKADVGYYIGAVHSGKDTSFGPSIYNAQPYIVSELSVADKLYLDQTQYRISFDKTIRAGTRILTK